MAKIKDRNLLIQTLNRLRLGLANIRYSDGFVLSNRSFIAPDDNLNPRTLVTRQTVLDLVNEGISGSSGSSGTSGTSGTDGGLASSGTSGSSGSSGTSGTSADPGTSGSSGTSGTSGTVLGENLSTTGKSNLTYSGPISSHDVVFSTPRVNAEYVAIVCLATETFTRPADRIYISVTNKTINGFRVNFSPSLENGFGVDWGDFELNWLVQDYEVAPTICPGVFRIETSDAMFMFSGFGLTNFTDSRRANFSTFTFSLSLADFGFNFNECWAAPYNTYTVVFSSDPSNSFPTSRTVIRYDNTNDGFATTQLTFQGESYNKEGADTFHDIDGLIYYSGGSDGGSSFGSDAIKSLEPNTFSIAQVGTMNTGRTQHSFTRAGEKALIFAGNSRVPSAVTFLDDAQLWDPAVGGLATTVAPASPVPDARARHSSFAIDCTVYNINGSTFSGSIDENLSFNILGLAWTYLQATTTGRINCGSANGPSDSKNGFIFGGNPGGFGSASRETEEYNALTDTWVTRADTLGGSSSDSRVNMASCSGRLS